MKKGSLSVALLSFIILHGCRNENITDPNQPLPPQTDRGVFIVNEGLLSAAGSISFYNITKDLVIQTAIGSQAGWFIPNDARVVNNKLYVVVNGGDRIYIRHAETFQALDSIAMPAGSGPGYLYVSDSTKAYVANYNGTVSLVNLASKTLVRTSARVVDFPGGLVVRAGFVYVSDYGLFPNFRNAVKVLDGTSLALVDSVSVGVAAGSMVSSGARVYVVCAGSFPDKGKVYAINAASNAVEDSLTIGDGPSDIAVRNQSLFVLHGDHVMKLNASPLTVADSLFIRIAGALYFYAMQVDDVTGDVYVSKIVSGGGGGEVEIYTSGGVLRRPSFGVGVFPGAFAFK